MSPPLPEPPSADVLSVGELDRRLKRAIEGAAVDAWVEGEIGSMRPSSSGHVYFVLKDESEDACIDCVMYRSSAIRAGRVLQDGARIRLRGRATLWAPRGRLQFVVDIARAAGRGALLEALEVLKQRLQDEGLFALERKRKIPTEPAIIGVVTSASGAAIHDIVQVAFRRGGARILLAPASVQGAEAPSQIIAAMDRLERVPGVGVIVIGRGGGASDDLSAFNDEALVRRVAACRVPVVSAVGHEVDITLTDLVADLRAATPSQAAELLIPSSSDRAKILAEITARLVRGAQGRINQGRLQLSRTRSGLVDPRTILGDKRQAVDDLELRLREAIRHRLVERQRRVANLDHRLSTHHPRTRLEHVRGELDTLEVRLHSAIRERVMLLHERLSERAASLHALSPLAVLGRGYAIALRTDGRAITRHTEVTPGESITVRVHRGELHATVTSTEEIAGTGLTPKPPAVSE